ncbi:MAG: FemAB family PEP-CTERM system-associated protein [Gammaproteobacteria bacterium]|nr:FemAB family PEP-CTERM system-associated protein [Gammaproteobacteria bacterium]
MSLSIQRLTQDLEPKWSEYALKNRASIYHDPRWVPLIKKVFGHDSHHIVALESGSVVGVLPMVQLKSLLFGNFMVSMPYFNYGGAIADNADVMRSLLKSAHELSDDLGCSHIEMRFDQAQDIGLPVHTEKVTMLLDLPDEPDLLWGAIGSKRRAQVKRPIREGVEFLIGGEELLDEFYSVFSSNMRDLGTPVYGKVFFREILRTFGGYSFISIVRLKGEPVGAGFLLGYQGKLEIPWASTLRKYNRLGINMYMYWNILKCAIEKKYQVFDFGRSSKDAGTLRFKKQWGSKERQLYWYYDMKKDAVLPGLSPSNKKYQVAISAWRRMPVNLTRVIGPHIVKNLP